jgi:hypothetical protein
MHSVPEVTTATHITLATPVRAVKPLGINELNLEHTHV